MPSRESRRRPGRAYPRVGTSGAGGSRRRQQQQQQQQPHGPRPFRREYEPAAMPGEETGAVPAEGRGRNNSPEHFKIMDDVENPKGKRYTSSNLSRAVVSNARKPIAERLNANMLAALQRAGGEMVVDDETKAAGLMAVFFSILDRAYFFDLVGQSITPRPVIFRDKDGKPGFYDRESRTININMAYVRNGAATRAHAQISTLLVEMSHAFFRCYSCECIEVCKKKASANRGGLGAGNGPPWIKAMVAIQKDLASAVTWPHNLEVERAVSKEMKTGWKPSRDELRAWGLDSGGSREERGGSRSGRGRRRKSRCTLQ
ncbi:hypothetical protein MBM_04969 [Drepanopeziza brunnea f. sp. 'multigermtubi' MB_m1]|uniref:Uncharacterized protein n=1 Tax=Marssonina brunnea f. sp. multigermtubi (strain MB_m1) TaxID=1072389 RepID=K1WG50_MARBU|nr:uncharacterized protein MBM_04969 [Drepanopeziza brunnea f. sp. 'multigermtubi' MB_m1]EKD16500.1 hypothetical protein MBM_04969 [Drepanopeziza brunnea f. sp. 'multigermtubi' MB_m1]